MAAGIIGADRDRAGDAEAGRFSRYVPAADLLIVGASNPEEPGANPRGSAGFEGDENGGATVKKHLKKC